MRHHFGVNKKEIVDVLIAALIVENAPTLLMAVAPSMVSGVTGTLVSGGVGYLAGKLLKKPIVSNAAIAVSVAKIVNEQVVSGLVAGIMPHTPATAAPLGSRLGAYSGSVMPSKNYGNVYAINQN